VRSENRPHPTNSLIKWQEDKKQETLRKAVLNRIKNKLNSEQPEDKKFKNQPFGIWVKDKAIKLRHNYHPAGVKMLAKFI
jgi:hypothetical protein